MKINIKQFFKKRQRPKETIVEFIFSVLSCWLLSVGVCLILDAQLSFQIGIKPILWHTLIAVVAAVLFTRKWWIGIIYFGVLVPVFFIAISLSGDIFTFFESLAGFLEWWISGKPINSPWYSKQGFYLVHIFVNFGVGILFFAVARIFKKAIITVALALVFAAANYANGFSGYNPLAIPFLVVGIFPLVAGEKFQRISQRSQKNMFGVFGKKWLVVFVSTFVAVIISAISVLAAFTNNSNTRNRFCSDIVADIQTITNTYTKEQKRLNVSLFDLGLVMNSTYIGGDLYSIKPEILASTDLLEETFVKVTSFDTFDGKMWHNDFVKSYRINGLWDKKQNQYLAFNLLDDPFVMKNINNIADKTTVHITLGKDTNFLPTIGQVVSFKENTKTNNPILYDSRGRLLSYYGAKKDYRYTIETLIYPTKQDFTVKQMRELTKSFELEEDPLCDKESDFYKKYTKTYGNLPKAVKAAVDSLSFDMEKEYERAFNICEYFSKNDFIYTDEPPKFEKGDDVIKRLFETKRGHCMYYATAMVMMARESGVPARLVAGYRTVLADDNKTQVIDKSSPYAWVECHIPHVGWFPFDPTPEIDESVQHTSGNGNSPSGAVTIPNVVVDVETEKDSERKQAGTQLKWETTMNVSAILLVSIIVLVIILLILNTLLSQKFYEIEKVKKRYTSTKKQVEFYYQDILRQLALFGIILHRGETIDEIIKKANTLLLENDDLLEKGAEIIDALHYGEHTPTDEETNQIFEIRRRLEDLLKKRINPIVYLLLRQTLLPIFSIAVRKYD